MKHAATLKIGTSDRTFEERVAGKGHFFFLAIEEHAARGVTRSVDNGKDMRAEADDIALLQRASHRRHLIVEPDTQQRLCLHGQFFHQRKVGLVYFGLQTESFVEGVVSEIVVDMGVGAEQMNGFETAVVDILHHGLSLFGIESAAIYDYAFAGLVGNHIAVFL